MHANDDDADDDNGGVEYRRKTATMTMTGFEATIPMTTETEAEDEELKDIKLRLDFPASTSGSHSGIVSEDITAGGQGKWTVFNR